MARIEWDISKKLPELINAGMGRLEKAGRIIQTEAKSTLKSKINPKHPPYDITRPEYKTGKAANKYWTARTAGNMIKTIRVVRKDDVRNIWIIAGNSRDWWAIQMEFGHAGWKGGSRSFLRPALKKSIPKIKSMLLNG